MKVLIYKRTHIGDPDINGIFGIQDCMGSMRNWNFDAVIGIGGNTPWKEDADIKHKINWIGLNPKKIKSKKNRGDYVVFKNFQLDEEKGLSLKENFPKLFNFMFGNQKRFSMSSNLPTEVFQEVAQILNSIKNCTPSKDYDMLSFNSLDSEKNYLKSICGNCDSQD